MDGVDRYDIGGCPDIAVVFNDKRIFVARNADARRPSLHVERATRETFSPGVSVSCRRGVGAKERNEISMAVRARRRSYRRP